MSNSSSRGVLHIRSQDELIQYLQDKLNDDRTKIEELRDAAFDLYSCTMPKPPIETNNTVIGIYDENGQYREESLRNYLNNKERIKFILFWYSEVVPILQLLSGVGKLPYNRSSRDEDQADFETFVTTKMKSYKDQLNSFKTENFLSAADLMAITENCKDLSTAVGKYLEGLPEEAFTYLKKCMERIEGLNLEPLTNEWWKNEPVMVLYKMRLGNSNHIYNANDMFHIPFEKRGLVRTNRYSIPGLPCVYLGSTPLTCWEEMGKPDLNTTHSSLFLADNSIRFFDISIPPTAWMDHFVNHLKYNYGVNDLTELFQMMRSYLILWPLIACCSIRVMNPDDAFKPEYIVSQLLLQWIQQSRKYDGVSYFSTKIDNYTGENFRVYQNFAFPVKERKGKGHCDMLRAKFKHITNAIPWQVYQIHKSTGMGNTAPSMKHVELQLMPDMPFVYNVSDFGRLETLLIDLLDNEKR